jgi:D-arginine dehydrogenase
MNKADFIIIGAGIAGASVAYELSKSGKVIVLERENAPGYHTTGRSIAILEKTYSAADKVVRALSLSSENFLKNSPEGFADYDLLQPRPQLYIAARADKEKLLSLYKKLGSASENIRLIEGEEIKKYLPILNDDYGNLAILVENELADIDVHALHEGYLKGMRERGGLLSVNSEVKGLARIDDVWSVETTSGDYSAPVIINAAGSWVDQIATMAGITEIGIKPLRRTVILVSPPEGHTDIDDWAMAEEVESKFYFKPDAGKLLVSPCDATLTEPCDAQPEEIDVAYAAHYFQECTDIEIRNEEQKWAGLRNALNDHYPAVGFAPEAEGFFWLAGQEGIGIMTSPAMARIAAAKVLGNEIPKDIIDAGLDEKSIDVARFFK